MKAIRILILLSMGYCIPVPALAAVEDSAAIYFKQEHYGRAIAIWQEAARERPVAALYFNSGLAYQALGQRTEAIYSFEQALRLKPWSDRIKESLRVLREASPDAIVPVNPFFLSAWYENWLAVLRPGQWALFGLLCICVVTLHVMGRNQILRVKPFLPGRLPLYVLVVGVCLVLTAFLSYQRIASKRHVLAEHTCVLYQGASDTSPVLRELGPGEKLTVTDAIGDWQYVTLSNLDKGWVQRSCTRVISLPGY